MEEEEETLLKYQQQRNYATIDRKRLSTASSQDTTVVECDSLFYWLNKYSTSIYLENKGSVARDHLANERTYLAWLRTSLSTISVGIGKYQPLSIACKFMQSYRSYTVISTGKINHQ
jgi:uncharacterized membrane protein YidH (DUF202 family)